MARLYHEQVYRRFGLPDKFISDRGPQFASKVFQELRKHLGIKSKMSTAYHPQTDGQTERINQELEQYLRLYVNHRQSDWSEWLSLAEFAYNNREHSATKMSPFYANSGRHPIDLADIRTASSNLSAEEFATHINEVHSLAQTNLSELLCFPANPLSFFGFLLLFLFFYSLNHRLFIMTHISYKPHSFDSCLLSSLTNVAH